MGKNNKKYTLDEVREIVESKGFELLSDEYVNNKTKLKIKDKDGYFGLVNLDSLVKNGSFHKFHKSNPYSIDNLKYYIKTNFSNEDYPILLSDKYLSATKRLKWECTCGDIFTRNLHNLISLKEFKCQKCSLIEGGQKRRLDLDTVLKVVLKNKLKLCGDYVNSSTKMKLKDEDGYYYSITFRSLNVGIKNLLKFGKANDYTIENIKKYIEENNLNLELVTSNMLNYNGYLEFKCGVDKCNEVFVKSVRDFIHKKTGCPFCVGQKVGKSNCLYFKNPEISSEWNYYRNGDLTPKQVTCGNGNKVWWKCRKCSHEWEATVGSRTNLKSGCPKCKSSKLELEIYNILNKYNIDFNTQHKFEDCKNIFQLPFDFYLSKHKVAIEAQGEGHYEPVNFFGGEEDFKKRQMRDQIKRDYCKKNNIKLIEIPYWDFDNIEEILIRELGLEQMK